jgi:D-tyrosyl-tRNA(Tyr) deacylase
VRAVIQLVSRADVAVAGEVVGRVGRGLLVFVGVARGDGPADVEYVASKVYDLRVFPDAEGRMNRAVHEVGGAVLVVSQFTLLGDVRRGRRPGFDGAATPDAARASYEALLAALRARGLDVASGVFQARMDVSLSNDGPVTILVDSTRAF